MSAIKSCTRLISWVDTAIRYYSLTNVRFHGIDIAREARNLEKSFDLYATPVLIDCDQGQYFNSEETKRTLRERGDAIHFSSSGASQSTGMVGVGNKLLQEVLQTSQENWASRL